MSRSSVSILREWDQASTSGRTQLLQWILTQFDSARYTDELESEYGTEIALLLPRIVVWMDKTRQQHEPSGDDSVTTTLLDQQLGCIQLFLSSASTHRYLREFLQADGLRVVLQILETDAQPHHHGVSANHRCMIYTILARIAQRGRDMKEQISRVHGELAMVRGAVATMDHSVKPAVNAQSRVWMLCRMTLLEQMSGNRACVDSTLDAIAYMVHRHDVVVRIFGAQILRELISERSFFFDHHLRQAKVQELVPLSIELLRSANIPLQHEGLELVHSLLPMPSTRKLLCTRLAEWIHDAAIEADPIEPAFVAMKHTREYDMYIHLRSSFVHAAQSLTTLMHSVPRILALLVQTHEVLIPMAFVLTVERPQSLKWHAALTALTFIFTRCRDVAANHLSQLFLVAAEHLLTLPRPIAPDALADELLRDEDHRQAVALNFFRNGWIRELPPVSSVVAKDDEGDPTLAVLAYDVDAAVHDIMPVTTAHVPYEEDDIEDNSDAMDFAMETQLRERLEKHFMKYRNFTK